MEEHPCRVRSELPAERVEDDWGFRMGRTGGSTRSASGLSNTSSHTLEKRLAHVIRMSSVQRLGLSRRTLSSCVFRHSRETSRTAAESCSVHCSWVSITFMNAFVCTLLHTPASSMGSRKGLGRTRGGARKVRRPPPVTRAGEGDGGRGAAHAWHVARGSPGWVGARGKLALRDMGAGAV